ncbi:cyclic nucleotide-binding protein [Magnetococcus marinus MC-1]|uniref:Cyclic nucleotide-binding protein n=1 Tax=Magnetococcus marinus (strain ATCC BAA-1437 / JCM 17883 / MC-1) TaxID=156889 RepID=A0LAG1_MAGMM|nr:bacteriohemerythrin [Magnetococcus marinus]ABK44954.1 cyclic nucleotide-binding protein [Magnetococcus marinus MC-1]
MDKLQKVSVARGIFWVEAPDADLRILCGCPADSVKHLMKRGLIQQREKGGVPCETGPNAILLSDVMLQNGELSNLGEFPVLQMLYKQGMILPNHPNNSGQKPLLIGRSEQVSAQMQYIFRGNYGLVSDEELMQAGVSYDDAQWMMRLKLRFAFGRIAPSNQLLEGLVVGEGKVEIRNGLFIERLATNNYRFSYQDETVDVDLNLEIGNRYETPYPLGYLRFKREYFAVLHSGEGDGWDVNRPSMSSILMFQGRLYLIDAGPNLYSNLSALGVVVDEIEGIFHTHAHDDHFCGITTLMRAGRRLKYFATPAVRATVQRKLGALLSMEHERFTDFFEIHDLQQGCWNNLQGLEVKPIFSPHPLETTIFQFRALWHEGYKVYAHYADIVSLKVLHGMIEEDTSKPGLSEALFNKVKVNYLAPVDLKKLDIGGGMIHGNAEDFRDDLSDKILLSHTALELNTAQKEIGSSAPYGVVDVLIHSKNNRTRESALQFLEAYFPEIPGEDHQALLNGDLVEFNPGNIMLKEGQPANYILLVLHGTVERISTLHEVHGYMDAGSFVGELAVLNRCPSEASYRAVNFVWTLRIPVFLFLEIIRRHGLLEKLQSNLEIRAFLQSSRLFGEGLSYPVLNRMLEGITSRRYMPGEPILCRDLTYLNMILAGEVRRMVGGEELDVLGARDFFGEEGAVFGLPCLFRLEVLEPTDVLQIPGELLQAIPIVRWKLYESYLRRAQAIIHGSENEQVFVWRDAFAIGVHEMDTHHKKLVEIANSIIEIIGSNIGKESLMKSMDALIAYTEYHFQAEEKMMEAYGYADLEHHHHLHVKLVSQVVEFQNMVEEKDDYLGLDFEGFFSDWLIQHILNEDRRYAMHLNDRCIF